MPVYRDDNHLRAAFVARYATFLDKSSNELSVIKRTAGYRADIDGLRAAAVLAVIGFHAGLHSLRNGFAGVDVFFVISGYLITGIIVGALEGLVFYRGSFTSGASTHRAGAHHRSRCDRSGRLVRPLRLQRWLLGLHVIRRDIRCELYSGNKRDTSSFH